MASQKNFAANLKIGAAMSSTVGRVFGAIKTRIKDQEKTLKDLRSAYKQAEKGTGEYAGKLDELKGKIGEAEKQLKKLKAAAKIDIGKSLKGVGNAFLGDAKRLAVGAGLIVGATMAAGGAIYHVTKGFVDWADDIGDTAEALGMSTQALQTWQFAAATVGVDAEKVGATFAKFSKAVMGGGKKTDEALSKLGINAGRLRKLKLDSQLKVFAEAFSRYKGADKVDLAMKLMGKSGWKIVGVLNKGAKGFEAFKEEGIKAGAVLDDAGAKAGNDAADALDVLHVTMTGLRNTIAIQFVPVFKDLVQRFSAFIVQQGPAIKEWASRFGDVMATKVVPKIIEFADKLPGMITKLGDMASQFWEGLNAVKNFVGGWENLGAIILAINFAPTIAAIVSLASSLWGLGAAAIGATGPIGWVVAGIVALGAAAAYLWTHQEKVGQWFLDTFPNAMETFGEWLLKAQSWMDDFMVGLDKWIGEQLAAGDRFREGIGRMWETIKTGAADAARVIREAFESFFKWFEDKWNAIGDSINRMWEKTKKLGEDLKGFFSFGASPTSAPGAQIAPPEAMPAATRSTAMNNNVHINVTTAPGTDGRQFGQQLRQELNRKPIYDFDGALVPA